MKGLTKEQQLFLAEAQAGAFLWYEDEGKVFAMGASNTDNLFSMEVEKIKEPDGGMTYWPKSQDKDS